MYELAKVSLNNLGNEIRSSERKSQEGTSNNTNDCAGSENSVFQPRMNNENEA